MNKKETERAVRYYLLKLLLKYFNLAEDIENLPDEYKSDKIRDLAKDIGLVPIDTKKENSIDDVIQSLKDLSEEGFIPTVSKPKKFSAEPTKTDEKYLEEQIKSRKELLKLYEKLEGNDKAKKIAIDICKSQIKKLQDMKYCDYSSKSSYDNIHSLIGELSELIVKHKIANSLEEHINILASWLKQIK